MNLSSAIESFLFDCKSRRLTVQTIDGYKTKLTVFCRWLKGEGVTDVSAVTSQHIKRLLADMFDRGLTDHTQHDYARAVRTFCNYLVRDEVLAFSPFSKVKMPKVASRLPIILTDTEIATVLRLVTSERNRLIVRFILDSGVRASELIALNVGDVEMETGIITVKAGKGQKDRLTFVGKRTRRDLQTYLAQRGELDPYKPLFVSEDKGLRMKLFGLMSAFRLMREETGIETLTAHTLRRTMTTKALANGMNLHVLSQILGHADVAMLKRYAAVGRELIQQQSQLYGVVDRL